MALNYNGTSPTAIKYNGTDLTVLKYGTTAVWGKPYSLSINAGANTSVTVSRTSSPNQGASTGTLSSGSVVYYGDVLTISYSVSSGYKISTSTVNGTTFTSGQSFTVTSAISVVTTAEASASWKTVWTGSVRKPVGSSAWTTSNLVNSTAPIRVTVSGEYQGYTDDDIYPDMATGLIASKTFELSNGKYIYVSYLPKSTWSGQTTSKPTTGSPLCMYAEFTISGTTLSMNVNTAWDNNTYYSYTGLYTYITKVEQYY